MQNSSLILNPIPSAQIMSNICSVPFIIYKYMVLAKFSPLER